SLVSTALPDSYAVTVKRDESGKVTGIAIKQPQGTMEFKREPDYTAPISVDELIAKAIEAAGGEDILRKHQSETVTGDVDLINQGVKGEITINRRSPDLSSSKITFEALGKKIGWAWDYFDGNAGAAATSFSPLEPMNASKVRDAKLQDAYPGLLAVRRLFKDFKITGVEKIDGDEAYITVLTPETGNPITYYFSTSSFRLIREDLIQEVEGQPRTVSETHSDFKAVDGQQVPFKIVQVLPSGGNLIITVMDVKFNVEITDSVFKGQ
ncbi:MAG: hypothetical protein ACREDR_18400, partial [Blastocatellia bacterium]